MATVHSIGAPTRTLSPPALPSVERLLTAPLSDLLTASRAQIVDSEVSYPGYDGTYVQLNDGQIILSLPASSARGRRDSLARFMLGRALGARIPITAFPAVAS